MLTSFCLLSITCLDASNSCCISKDSCKINKKETVLNRKTSFKTGCERNFKIVALYIQYIHIYLLLL